MARVIAIGNNKGGTSKTTTAISLAGGLARKDKKVLLIDMDPQANATDACGYDTEDQNAASIVTIMDKILTGIEILPSEGIFHHEEGFDLIPSNPSLSITELKLAGIRNRESVLKEYIRIVEDEYDFIILDCMTSLGLLTINAFTCANSILIPLQAQYYSVRGLEHLIRMISGIKQQLNKDLQVEGLLLTLVDSRTNLSKEIISAVKEIYGNNVRIFKEMVPIATKAAETPAEGVTIFKHDPRGKVAFAYQSLVEEVLSSYADVLTAQDVSAILRVERKLGYQFLSSGKVDIFYVGKSIRVYKPKLIAYLSSASELRK